MKKVNHQIDQKIPSWEVEYLFVGTFNPKGGKHVPYYYGREKNQFWKLLSSIFDSTFEVDKTDFFEQIIKHKIACIDIIDSIEKSNGTMFSEIELENICGKGYSDSVILSNKYKRNYSTELINKIISENKNIKVYSTWGKGKSLKNWNIELSKIKFNANLVSPSLAARIPKGMKKFDFMISDWKSKIK
jgi:hypothetical protein